MSSKGSKVAKVARRPQSMAFAGYSSKGSNLLPCYPLPLLPLRIAATPAGVVGPQAIRDTFRDVLTQDPDLGKTDLIKKVYLKLMGQKVSRAQVEAEYYALLSDNLVGAEATGEKNKTAHRWVEGDE